MPWRFPVDNFVRADKAFFFQDFGNRGFQLGARHRHNLMLCEQGVVYAGQHISNRITNAHFLSSACLPRRFDHAGDFPCQGALAEADAAHSKAADISPWATAYPAAVSYHGWVFSSCFSNDHALLGHYLTFLFEWHT